MKKLRFLAADFEKRKKEKKSNSPNLSNIFVKGTLILKDCGIASYPYSNYGASNLLFRFNNSHVLQSSRSQIFVKKYKIIRTFNSVMKTGGSFIRLLAKAVRNRQNEHMKN